MERSPMRTGTNEKLIVAKDYFRSTDVNEGHYSKKREGVADVDPKVMEPFEPIPGKPPRKVVIDRQRKLFASLDIEALLAELGIDYQNQVKLQEDWLPLQAFDDAEYDCREPAEWIAYGEQPDGNFCPIPGKGLCIDDNGLGRWKAVLIHSYDKEREKYTGYWDGTTDFVELFRINLLFDSEDPRIFAQRVAQAHSERKYADSQIRYNFFVDCMPQQGLHELDTEQQSRILNQAMNSRTLKNKNIDKTNIMFEVQMDFGRTMNQIVMEKFLSQPPEQRNDMIPDGLTMPEKAPQKKVPYFGQITIPQHDFASQFSNFQFNSLFIKDEVIVSMVKIREECNFMQRDNQIWNTKLDKVMRIEEFKQNQSAAIQTMKFNTGKEGWVGKLEKIIKASFKDVGKGWFNINENQKETYEFGKLKKFLTLVNFMMQDTVLNICKDSVNYFVEFMLDFIPEETMITNTATVKNRFKNKHADSTEDESDGDLQINDNDLDEVKLCKKWINSQFQRNKDPEPLFQLDLIPPKQGFLIPHYNNPPESVCARTREIFEEGIKSLQEIPQLEPILLHRLFRNKSVKNIKAPNIPHEEPKQPDNEKGKPRTLIDENVWLWHSFEKLNKEMERAIKPLQEYVQTFANFQAESMLDPSEYVQNIENMPENERWTPEKIRDDIYEHRKLEQHLLSRIPETINVSMFRIVCNDIRNMYAQKYKEIQEREIAMIAGLAKQRNTQLTFEFRDITNKVTEEPRDIDHLNEIKNYINECGIRIKKKQTEIQECMGIYKILEEFNYQFTNAEQNAKWDLFGAPQKLVKIIEVQSSALDKEKERMAKQMELDQEAFNEEIEGLMGTVGEFHKNNNPEKYMQYAKEVDSYDQKIMQLIEQSRVYNQREFIVGKETTDYSALQKMQKDFQPYSTLWKSTRQWHTEHNQWMTGKWENLNASELVNTFESCQKNIAQCYRFFRDRDYPQVLQICETMKTSIEEFKPIVPLAEALRKDGMLDRHWEALSAQVGFQIKPDEDFTLTSCIKLGMQKHVAAAEEIGEKAYKEFHIRKSLDSMKKAWENQVFRLPRFKQTPTCTIAGFDEALALLDEHIVNTQAMQFSPFKKPFEEEINIWCAQLLLCSDTLEEWIKCQASWTYLQPIFDSADIMKQLPIETKRFKSVDTKWKLILGQAVDRPGIMHNCTKDGLKENFAEANKALDTVQKGLNEYLEKKRSNFARFYFLSDGELLEILSQTKEVRLVRSHLRKVFEAINDLEFKPNDDMVAMISGEGEKIEFVKKVSPTDRNVEFWMGDVEKQMVASVRAVFEQGLIDYVEQARNAWIVSHAGMIVLNASQVHWTREVEEALAKSGSEGIKEFYKAQLKQLESTVMLVRQKLTKLAKISVNALIVIDVHARSVIEELIEFNVSDPNGFEWIKQLRYYWQQDPNDEERFDVQCKCVATVFPYGYEYLGNTGRLVITPLTDKCYMTLMGALQLNLGGAPAGPAGTGKTESTKDLAKALAKHCVVFNCSGDMTHTMVATFFKGLAASGAWCCFDEFNRINIEVLSVIAQYLLQLFKSKAMNDPEINFQGSKIKMKPTFCVFITMNPGYAGRTELPDNLKALFRAVAMMVPDYALIGEIMLYSFGFLQGKALARKMVTTFTLSSEQLSTQDHYDYGMRAVRSVINAAGLLKNDYPDMDEQQLLLRALRDVNVPKFLKDDLPLFENIILDLFPGVDRPVQEYSGLIEAIDVECKRQNVQNIEKFNLKVIQLYDTIQVRHGLMIVGPTGGGKTRNYQVLAHSITSLKGKTDGDLFQRVRVDVLNPKSITMGQLYGFVENSEWQDGVLAKMVNECSKDETPDKRWILFDGPVDALWIENMNTVLDDNKKLCLNSGQIIQLTPRMTMMFEVEDLAVASPATVSRCGMVYMEPESLGLGVLVTSWLNTIPEKVAANKFIVQQLQQLFDEYLDDGCYFVRKNCPELVKTVDNNLAQSCMRILDCFFSVYIEDEVKKVTKDQIDSLSGIIKQLFFFSFIWSIGATTTAQGREKFSLWIRERLTQQKVSFPEEKSVYDWNFNLKTNEWETWFDTIEEYSVDIKLSFNEIVVPTQDSIRMKHLAKMLIMSGKHIMMPGPIGTGKSVYIQQLSYEMPEEYQTLKQTFSAQTSANQVQDFMDGKFDKHRKGVYGPPIGKKFIVYIDDLNMPMKEEFGAMPPIELIRQFMDHDGWYDRIDKEKPFKTLKNLIFISAFGPPGGGRQHITQRLQRHYNFLTYTEMLVESMTTIFNKILSAFYYNFTEAVQNCVKPLVDASLEVYDNILNGPLKPIPSKSHYTFNLRDISKIFQGLCNANVKLTTQPVHVNRLWIHENKRVFGDRLTDNKDRHYLEDMLMDKALTKFQLDKKFIMNSERLIFGDFMDGVDVENRIYKQIEDLKGFQTKIEEYLDDYNGSVKKPMHLVMFLDACDHVARITRIIRQPLGNAFLLGVGGSGRQSLARLATFCANYKSFQIEVVKGYSFANWREDVKKVLMQAGVDNKPTSFLFVDTQIINEQMLEDINNILNGGDVSGLYKKEDYEPIYKVGKQMCMEKNIPVIPLNMFSQYLTRLQKNIHMIIAMSPLGEVFRKRLRQFPSLVTCCTLDWFTEWPEEALLGVGKGQIMAGDTDLGQDLDKCVETFKFIHQSVEKASEEYKESLQRINYVTPTSFLEQLAMYKVILKQTRESTLTAKNRLVRGLQVLQEAATEIAKLQKTINEMAPELEKTKKELATTLEIVAKEKADADVEKAKVAIEEEDARQQEEEASVLKKDAQAQLDEALPMLEEATKVLKELKKDDLYVLNSLNTPTPNVVKVMELSCHMFQLKPGKGNLGKMNNDTHGFFHLSKQNLLNNPNAFIKNMIDYDKEHIPDSVVKKVKLIIDNPEFSLEAVKQSSEALLGICKWAMAMVKYYELLKIVNPKRAKVAEMTEKLKKVQAELDVKRKMLAAVQEKLDRLEAKMAEMMEKDRQLTQKIEDCNKKLERANKIIEGLSGEKSRWTETVSRLTIQFDLLIGNCLVAAGMVAYSGSFTSQFRSKMESEWCQYIEKIGIKVTKNIKMQTILEDPVQTSIWTKCQLPSDNLSIENAIIMFKSRRWPLMIDPQNQSNRFIKNLAKDEEISKNGIDSCKASDPNLMKKLERCIQNGKWFLIENVNEELDPSLEPILLKQVAKDGTLRLGDKSIPYDKDFKFFMTTTIPNPHYSPETQVKVTLLNFAITPTGLEEQMLNQFISQELPEQMKKKEMIIIQNALSAKTLRDVENKILASLAKHTDISMILEDDEVINILAESKVISDDINIRVKESAKEEQNINIQREIFRPVAFRAQTLFFSIVDLALIDPMYQYSLQWFANLYGSSIDNSTKTPDNQARIKNLNDHFTLNLYENVCRSLFERHKLMFSFKITLNILFGMDKMDPTELRFFFAGPSGEVKIAPNPTEWLGDLEWAECYKQVYSMSLLDGFKGFDQFFIKNQKKFQTIFDSKEPQTEPIPGEWNTKLNSFQKMIVLKAIRPDKVTNAVQNFIIEWMGQQFVEPPVFNLSKSYKDSSITTPLIFVLSTGSDPVSDWQRFAEKMNMTKKCENISLGRGMGPLAEKMISENLIRGGWVLLMNCHLATSWMSSLESIVESMDDTQHRDFRLWLTSMPNKSFPVSVLQNSVKMTLEPPSGLKQNVLSTYEALDVEDFEGCTKPHAYKKLLFGFAFFHAIVQDRRKFGPIGWNIPYAFTNEDLTVSRRQLKIFIETYEEVPYKVLNYIGAAINYGGRVTDDKDVRLIDVILRGYMNENMLQDDYPLSKSGIYRSIPVGDIEDYIDYIKQLPLNPDPEAFGLHDNAEITTNQISTSTLLEDMISMQPKASKGKGKSREEIIGDQAKFLQEKTPPVFDLEMVAKKYPTSYEESMNTVLFQECVRYNGLLAVMKVNLIAVQKALIGEIVMSEDLEKMAQSIYDNMVPLLWQQSNDGFLSMKPLASWILDCNERINFLVNWINNGTPIVYWISGFFFPQAFLTGTLQNYARKRAIAVDRVSFRHDVKDHLTKEKIKEKPEVGCLVYGCYLEGCKWNYNTHMLDQSDPKKLFVEMPMIHMMPVEDRVQLKTGIYRAPMYKVLSRTGTLSTTGHSTNFVIYLELPTDIDEEIWIRSGVAVFLALKF